MRLDVANDDGTTYEVEIACSTCGAKIECIRIRRITKLTDRLQLVLACNECGNIGHVFIPFFENDTILNEEGKNE